MDKHRGLRPYNAIVYDEYVLKGFHTWQKFHDSA